MKILFDDIVPNCSISATSSDANYPVQNIQHDFLRKRWQSTLYTDTITITPTAGTAIDCIFLDYTNATSVSVSINGGFPVSMTNKILSFDEIVATEIQVEFTCAITDFVYVGKISAGIAYKLDPPQSFWDETFEDRSIVSVSQSGQVMQEYFEPLRIYNFTWPTLDRTETRALQAMVNGIGVGKPIFIDPNTDALPIMYCRISEPITTNKTLRQYKNTLKFVEAR